MCCEAGTGGGQENATTQAQPQRPLRDGKRNTRPAKKRKKGGAQKQQARAGKDDRSKGRKGQRAKTKTSNGNTSP